MAHHIVSSFGVGPRRGALKFERKLRVYTSAFLALQADEGREAVGSMARRLEASDKAVLHQSLLYDLQDFIGSSDPLIFEVRNASLASAPSMCVGVLEFSADAHAHGCAYLPAWVAHNLMIEDGMECIFRRVKLPRLRYMRLSMDPAFASVCTHTHTGSATDPRRVFEDCLHAHTCVNEGSELVLHYADGVYGFRVLEIRPRGRHRACTVTDTDVEVVFGEGEGEPGAQAPAEATRPRELPHRPLGAGDTVSDVLPDAESVAYFTVNVRPGPAAALSTGVRMRLTATPMAQTDAAVASSSGGSRARAASGVERTGAADAPSATRTPLFGSTPKVTGMSAAGVSAEFMLGPTASPALPVTEAGVADLPALDGTLIAVPTTAGATGAAKSLADVPRTIEADMFISTGVSKPTRRMFTWADYRAVPAKEILISPSDPGFPPVNDLGAAVFYVAVIAHGGGLSFNLAIDSVLAQDAPRTVAAVVKPAPGAAATLVEPVTAVAVEAAAVATGYRLCDNCKSAVPEGSYMMHVTFCRRNMTRCATCGASIRIAERASHVHCTQPGCGVLCGSRADVLKHIEHEHAAWPCDLCGDPVTTAEYEKHITSSCKSRRVECTYCKLAVPFKDVEEHEAMCGGRTVPCDVCGKLIPRKRLDKHRSLEHHMGAPGLYADATPDTPFLAAPPSNGLPPDFELDGAAAAAALNGAPTRAPLPGLTWDYLADDGDDEGEESSPEDERAPFAGSDARGLWDGAPRHITPQDARARLESWFSRPATEPETRPDPAIPAAGAFGSDSVRCASCSRLLSSFEVLQVHVITDCPERGTEKHAALLQSLFGITEEDSATAAPPPAPEMAASSEEASVAVPVSSVPDAATAASGPSRPRRRRPRWRCVRCDAEFVDEEDAHMHVLTECEAGVCGADETPGSRLRAIHDTAVPDPPLSAQSVPAAVDTATSMPSGTTASADVDADHAVVQPRRGGSSFAPLQDTSDTDEEEDVTRAQPADATRPAQGPADMEVNDVTDDDGTDESAADHHGEAEELARAIAASLADAAAPSTTPDRAGDAVVVDTVTGGVTSAAPAVCSCGFASSDAEAMHMHMLTECVHASEHTARLFGSA